MALTEGKHSDYFAFFFLGLCFFEIDRMITFLPPLAANGAVFCAIAAAISASTSGLSKIAADSARRKRF
jgi:hypothetical protein